jgi:hypothetical protein
MARTDDVAGWHNLGLASSMLALSDTIICMQRSLCNKYHSGAPSIHHFGHFVFGHFVFGHCTFHLRALHLRTLHLRALRLRAGMTRVRLGRAATSDHVMGVGLAGFNAFPFLTVRDLLYRSNPLTLILCALSASAVKRYTRHIARVWIGRVRKEKRGKDRQQNTGSYTMYVPTISMWNGA